MSLVDIKLYPKRAELSGREVSQICYEMICSGTLRATGGMNSDTKAPYRTCSVG